MQAVAAVTTEAEFDRANAEVMRTTAVFSSVLDRLEATQVADPASGVILAKAVAAWRKALAPLLGDEPVSLDVLEQMAEDSVVAGQAWDRVAAEFATS